MPEYQEHVSKMVPSVIRRQLSERARDRAHLKQLLAEWEKTEGHKHPKRGEIRVKYRVTRPDGE